MISHLKLIKLMIPISSTNFHIKLHNKPKSIIFNLTSKYRNISINKSFLKYILLNMIKYNLLIGNI